MRTLESLYLPLGAWRHPTYEDLRWYQWWYWWLFYIVQQNVTLGRCAWLNELEVPRQPHFPLTHRQFSSFSGKRARWYGLILSNELKKRIIRGRLERIFIPEHKKQYREEGLRHVLLCFLHWMFFYEHMMLGLWQPDTDNSLKLSERKYQRKPTPLGHHWALVRPALRYPVKETISNVTSWSHI